MAELISAAFWIDAAERALRSFAQGTLTALGIGAANQVAPGVSVPWSAALAFGGIMAALSVLMSMASIKVPGADPATGSFLPPEPFAAVELRSWWRARRKNKNEG